MGFVCGTLNDFISKLSVIKILKLITVQDQYEYILLPRNFKATSAEIVYGTRSLMDHCEKDKEPMQPPCGRYH